MFKPQKAFPFILFLLLFTIFVSCKSQADKDVDESKNLINNDRYSDAIPFLTKCIEKYPNDARFYYDRGYCYLRMDKNAAKEDFANCIRIDPKYHNGYYGLAMTYRIDGQFELADKNYNKAIELAPDKERKGTFMNGLANLYASKKDFKKAIETQKKSLELKDDGASYLWLGQYLLADGQKKEAVSTWLKAIDEKQFNQVEFKHNTYFELSKYYFQEKDYVNSKRYIEKAIELAPSNDNYVQFFNQIKSHII